MKRYLLPLTAFVLISNLAFGNKPDTTILYFRTIYEKTVNVSSIEEADYFRMVLPPDSGDDHHNIREYYRSGKIKLIAKIYSPADTFDPKSINVVLDGDCISYFENGKRSGISHFKLGNKTGLEYLFYPSGAVYCCLKHNAPNAPRYDNQLSWECYDLSGAITCKEGNGKWIVYDNNYQNIELTGEVVNGLREGVWKGSIIVPDSINYQYLFKNGHILSSIGYDKRGAAYPFKIAHERANYRTGQITFVDVLRSHIKIPKDTTRRRMSVDTSSLSFVVEKDGHIDEFSILGETIAPLKEAVFAALRQCDHWNPNKLYGITFRTRITIPIKEISEYSNGYYVKLINYTEKILKDN